MVISFPIFLICRCGIDAVILHWQDMLLVVGSEGNWLKYSYDGVVCLSPEIDGTRILCSNQCEFLVGFLPFNTSKAKSASGY